MSYKVGDILTYELSAVEGKGAILQWRKKYGATGSFPQRAVKVSESDLIVSPLRTTGRQRSIPKTQARRVASFPPGVLRKEGQQLYPKASRKEAIDQLMEVVTQSDQSEEGLTEDLLCDSESEEVTSQFPSRKRA